MIKANAEMITFDVPKIVNQKQPEVRKLEEKYGSEFMLNSGGFEDYDIEVNIKYTVDKNGNIILENNESQKYKYRYIIVKTLMGINRNFTIDCLTLMNVEYNNKPTPKQGFSIDMNFDDVYYGIQDEISHAEFDDIDDEEFNNELRFPFLESPVLQDVQTTTFTKNITEYINNVPDRFWSEDNCLFYGKNYVNEFKFQTLKKGHSLVKQIQCKFK